VSGSAKNPGAGRATPGPKLLARQPTLASGRLALWEKSRWGPFPVKFVQDQRILKFYGMLPLTTFQLKIIFSKIAKNN
jgi:hypothetical protein